LRLRNPKESAATQLCHKAEVEGITSPNGVALLNWQKSGEGIFKRFAQNQMELRQFISGRWEQYLNLPGQISQCRSLRELGELQSTFLSKFASDYLLEAGKLAGSVAMSFAHTNATSVDNVPKIGSLFCLLIV